MGFAFGPNRLCCAAKQAVIRRQFAVADRLGRTTNPRQGPRRRRQHVAGLKAAFAFNRPGAGKVLADSISQFSEEEARTIKCYRVVGAVCNNSGYKGRIA